MHAAVASGLLHLRKAALYHFVCVQLHYDVHRLAVFVAAHEEHLVGVSLHYGATEERPDFVIEPTWLVTFPPLAADVLDQELVGSDHHLYFWC